MSEMTTRVAAALERLPIRDLSEPGGELDKLRLLDAARAAVGALPLADWLSEWESAEAMVRPRVRAVH